MAEKTTKNKKSKKTDVSFILGGDLKIDVDSILFAEFALPGGMGAAGQMAIHTLVDEKLVTHNFSYFNEKERAYYEQADDMFQKCVSMNLIDSCDAHFGNFTYKKKGIKFERDDDHIKLIYRAGKKSYEIPVSCFGVYFACTGLFAEPVIDLEKLHGFIEMHRRELEPDELQFLCAYGNIVEKFENGDVRINLTIEEYFDAITLVKFNNGENVEAWDSEENYMPALFSTQKYRIKYIIETIGWMKLHNFMKKFIEGKSLELFKGFDKILGEKQSIGDKFTKIRKGKSDYVKLDEMKNLFEYPVIIDFNKSAREKIEKDIIKADTDFIRTNADGIAFYLCNYFWHLFDWGFDEIEEVCWHIIDECPNDDDEKTCTEKMFWMAAHIINAHWKRLGGKKNLEFEEKIFEHFYGRIDGTWPIFHFGEFSMGNKMSEYSLNESIGFIFSCEPETWEKYQYQIPIKEFLMTDRALNSKHQTIKHFAEIMQGKTAES